MPTQSVRNLTNSLAMALFLVPTVSKADPLFEYSWTPVKVGASKPLPTKLFLQLNSDGGVRGNGGCNNFKSRFVMNSDAILFSPLSATMMYCDENIMNAEYSFLAAIEAARFFSVRDEVLELRDAEGTPVVRLVPYVDN